MRRRIRSAAFPVHRHALPQLLLDGVLVALAYLLAFWLRFEGSFSGPNQRYWHLFNTTVLWVVAVTLIALAALAIAACWLPIRMRFPFDDTYITFRYAANLAHGFGIVWNVGGAHTEGYTNFLFVLLLAPFSAMGIDLVIVAQAIGVIAVVVSAISIYRVAQTLVRDSRARSQTKVASSTMGATLAVALFLLDPFTWMNAYSGLETSLFVMWLLLAVYAFVEQRTTLAFAFATLATLTRPEGALMGMILLLVGMASSRRITNYELPRMTDHARITNGKKVILSWMLACGLPLLVYAGWKLWYFGNLLPNSFYIKVAQADGTTFLPGRGTVRIFYEGIWYLLPFAIIAVWKLWSSAVVKIATLWCVLLSTFYAFSLLIQNDYERFMYSMEVMLILLTTVGVTRLGYRDRSSRWIFGIEYEVPPNRRRALDILRVIGITGLFTYWAFFMRGGLALGYIERTDEARNPYPRVAEVFRSIPNHEAITLAWGDAGRLPYFSGLLSIDPVGLNTNEIAHAHSAEEVVRYILRARPELIIIPLVLPKDDTIPNDTCQRILGHGHGLIGSAYPALARAALASTYKPIAMMPQTIYDLDLLADTTSPHYRDIVNTIVPRIGHDIDFEKPVQSIK